MKFIMSILIRLQTCWILLVICKDVNKSRLTGDSKKISSSRITFLARREFRESEQSAIKRHLFSSDTPTAVYDGLQSTDTNWVGREEESRPPPPDPASTAGLCGVCWTEHVPDFQSHKRSLWRLLTERTHIPLPAHNSDSCFFVFVSLHHRSMLTVTNVCRMPWHVHVLPLINMPLAKLDNQLLASDWLKWTNYSKQEESTQQALQQALSSPL